jgi:lipoprotein-releasing system ATP-binding protein
MPSNQDHKAELSSTAAHTKPLRDKEARATVLEARKIDKTFSDNFEVQVLHNLDLELRQGEMVAIVGVSGTGKSTLMHILGTLDKPTQGNLYYEGADVFAKSSQELSAFRNKTIGFIFQFHHLLPEFSAVENIMMPGLIAGVDKNILQDRANDFLNKIGLAARARHKVGELSGGEQQRVAIARALIMRPSILLADEPTGNLDPKTGQHVFDLISELNESFNLTTVMVTHNYALADRMDRCLTLVNGKLQ